MHVHDPQAACLVLFMCIMNLLFQHAPHNQAQLQVRSSTRTCTR
jgi:hypothetical protein